MAVAAVAGLFIGFDPRVALVVIGFVGMSALIRVPLVPRVVALVLLTAIVPFEVQNRYGIAGGRGSPGLLLSDALLFTGLVSVAPRIVADTSAGRRRMLTVLLGAFLVCLCLQFLRGLALGRSAGTVGQEFRGLFGFAVFFLVLPVLRSERDTRRLLKGLLLIGLLLGAWGLAQWFLHVGFGAAGDVGVRSGVRFTTAGRGQLQGGLYAFPVAVLVALAVLLSGAVRSLRVRLLVLAVLVVNAVCLLLTYERTFWLATAAAACFIIARAEIHRLGRAVFWGVVVVALGFAVLQATSATDLTAARQRLFSVGQYSVDNSVRYRLTESDHVLEQITAHPLVGSGLGATVFWGRPWAMVPPAAFTFSHNGYLWLAWKLGVPGALFLLLWLGCAVAWPTPPLRRDLLAATRNGCRASLIALFIIAFTFPSFSQMAITTTIGLLVAVTAASSGPRNGTSPLLVGQAGRDRPATPKTTLLSSARVAPSGG